MYICISHGYDFTPPQTIWKYFAGLRHWYIPIIMILYLLFFQTRKYINKKIYPLIMFILINILNLVLYTLQVPENWYMSNYTFLLGIILSLHKEDVFRITAKNNFLVLFSLFLFILTSFIYPFIGNFKFAYFVIKNLSALSWGTFIIMIAVYFPLKNSLLLEIGKSSLFIYVVHINVLELLKAQNNITWPVLLLVMAVSVLISYILYRTYHLIIKYSG